MSPSSPSSVSKFCSTAPLTISAKAPPAQAVLMTLSPPKCTNICQKENCTIHVPKEVDDSGEMTEIMGCLSLGDISNKNSRSNNSHAPGQGVVGSIPRPLSKPLVRKPKAIHNMASIIGARHLRDTCLTPHGKTQALSLQNTFPYPSSTPKVKYIFSSPLRRTINTAIYGFQAPTSRGIPITLWPDLREFGHWQCNTGTRLFKLRQEIKDVEKRSAVLKIDTRLMYGGWEWNFEMGTARKMERVERVKRALKMLEEVVVQGGEWNGMKFEASHGEDVGIVIVSHGGFLRSLMGYQSQRWYNAEIRTFKFPSPSKVATGHPPLSFLQTKASLANPHIPIPQTGPPFHMVIDNTTQERLAEIAEYKNHVEAMKRANWKGKARVFQHHVMKEDEESDAFDALED
ncbi:uncharacterized protein RCO7_02231 [Rhynchosporium graminicola]|uniref:Phosphoglycerate mutase family protein n=1 Tax=Rhynchosporium graminicola TaxID=2792576 RepID=A0A1E1LHA5_9HELO|nr:uncharacterized protein RCO7_02231 [Rhynchosporium commune]